MLESPLFHEPQHMQGDDWHNVTCIVYINYVKTCTDNNTNDMHNICAISHMWRSKMICVSRFPSYVSLYRHRYHSCWVLSHGINPLKNMFHHWIWHTERASNADMAQRHFSLRKHTYTHKHDIHSESQWACSTIINQNNLSRKRISWNRQEPCLLAVLARDLFICSWSCT